jgi:uncharacterized protein YegP (UPF0339 family)
MEVIEKKRRIFAIIIAIETYRYTDISKVNYAENDARAFRQLLIDYFGADEEDITLWINEEATKNTFEEELPYYIRQLSPGDEFIFYYAGHGFHHTDSNRLTVWDSHKNNLFGTTVSINNILLNPLLKSECQRSLIFLDSCSTYISDNLTGRDLISSMSIKEFEDFSNSSKYNATFCSCSPGEKSFPSDTLKHGIWTWHLIEALKGNMPTAIFKDVFITDISLQNYLRKAIPLFITKHTTIKGTQIPYSKVFSSNTVTIRQLPLPKEEEIVKNSPNIKLRFNEINIGQFVIKTTINGQYYFNLKANNGQVILTSEQYTAKAACNNGIDSVKANAKDDSKYDRKTSTNGKYYFNLKAVNGQIIGTSEMYETAAGRDNGIESVKSIVPGGSMGQFVIKTATNGQYYFNLKANNGQVILTSEQYTTKAACNNGIDSVKANAKDDSKYDRQTSTNDKYYFNLKAVNGQIIGTSEMYETAAGRDNGIESVKSNAPGASVTEE